MSYLLRLTSLVLRDLSAKSVRKGSAPRSLGLFTTSVCSYQDAGPGRSVYVYTWYSVRGCDAVTAGKTYRGPALHKLTDMRQILRSQQLCSVDMELL